ncbi:MAG: hypothetical protein ACYS8Y_06560 [Planctomycetota bacterium]
MYFVRPEGPPYDDQLLAMYEQIELKGSDASDVLTLVDAQLEIADFQQLSQSKSVIALKGKKKKGYRNWLNMVGFAEGEIGEYEMTARRKYLLIADEKPKNLFARLFGPWAGLKFDCEMVVESAVLDQPYADDNSRRIAILKQVLENARKDIKEVASDNKELEVCGMLINQGLQSALVRLDSSPVLAGRLSEPAGMEFSHMSFDRGRIRMLFDGVDIVTIKMGLGSFVQYLSKQQEQEALTPVEMGE